MKTSGLIDLDRNQRKLAKNGEDQGGRMSLSGDDRKRLGPGAAWGAFPFLR